MRSLEVRMASVKNTVAANASSKASFNLKHLSLASINHSHNDVWYVLESIGKANHGMLLRAGNETYMRLCQENGGLKAALEAGRYVSFSLVKTIVTKTLTYCRKMTAKLIDEMSATNTRGLPRSLAPTYEQEEYPPRHDLDKSRLRGISEEQGRHARGRRQGNKVPVPR